MSHIICEQSDKLDTLYFTILTTPHTDKEQTKFSIVGKFSHPFNRTCTALTEHLIGICRSK